MYLINPSKHVLVISVTYSKPCCGLAVILKILSHRVHGTGICTYIWLIFKSTCKSKICYTSGQIIATSHDQKKTNGGLVREFSWFQENPGW